MSGVWEAKSLSVLVFLPSLYLCSVACRLGPGRVVPVQGHYSSAWPCMEGIPAYRTQPTESEAWLAGWALWSPQTLLLSWQGLWRQVEQQCWALSGVGTYQGNTRAEYQKQHTGCRGLLVGLGSSAHLLFCCPYCGAVDPTLSPVLMLGVCCCCCFVFLGGVVCLFFSPMSGSYLWP